MTTLLMFFFLLLKVKLNKFCLPIALSSENYLLKYNINNATATHAVQKQIQIYLSSPITLSPSGRNNTSPFARHYDHNQIIRIIQLEFKFTPIRYYGFIGTPKSVQRFNRFYYFSLVIILFNDGRLQSSVRYFSR